MDFFANAFQFLIIYIIFSNLIKIGLTLFNKSKAKAKVKERQKKQEVMKEKQAPVVEKVIDPICNTSIEKEKSYIIVEDEENKYFCSWDCRQKYLSQKNDK